MADQAIGAVGEQVVETRLHVGHPLKQVAAVRLLEDIAVIEVPECLVHIERRRPVVVADVQRLPRVVWRMVDDGLFEAEVLDQRAHSHDAIEDVIVPRDSI